MSASSALSIRVPSSLSASSLGDVLGLTSGLCKQPRAYSTLIGRLSPDGLALLLEARAREAFARAGRELVLRPAAWRFFTGCVRPSRLDAHRTQTKIQAQSISSSIGSAKFSNGVSRPTASDPIHAVELTVAEARGTGGPYEAGARANGGGGDHGNRVGP